MADVVPIKAEALVWVCNCECSTFRCYANGTMECADCGLISDCDRGGWVRELPEPTYPVREVQGQTKVIALQEPRYALQNMMRKVNPEELVALIAIETNGRVRTWGGVSGSEGRVRARWLRQQLKTAYDLMTIFLKQEKQDA